MSDKLLFVIYDGIQNSVFQSQVYSPLLNQLKENPNLFITLVSFEKKQFQLSELEKLCKSNSRLNIVILRRLPFLGKLSFIFSIYTLREFLSKNHFSKVICRGPLASYVLLSSVKSLENFKKNLSELVIQARGLCGEELRFANQFSADNFIKKFIKKFLNKKLSKLEHEVFSLKKYFWAKSITKIESVSPALSKYLIDQFGADKNSIFIATKDIPQKLSSEQKQIYKQVVRESLGINKNALVYCYSGSAKPWQCAEETINYFLDKFKENNNCFLLILSSDHEFFETKLLQTYLPKNSYLVKNVTSTELLKYLAACDVGILLRHSDIINWVSRPTKMLEYQAVGLKIEHNDTIEILKNSKNSQNFL